MSVPDPLGALGRLLVVAGLALAALGGLFWGLGAAGLLGHLPGDLALRRGRWSIYLPLASSLLLSALLTLLVNGWLRLRR
ncbi:MAG TPA: DUF2905 family protein [Myxococcales bacterium]|nr:DUF2905 family protein [Myxococcales bacterium]